MGEQHSCPLALATALMNVVRSRLTAEKLRVR